MARLGFNPFVGVLRTLSSTASALVLELVDRHDSGSCVRKGVEVQVLSRALFFLASFRLERPSVKISKIKKLRFLTTLSVCGLTSVRGIYES